MTEVFGGAEFIVQAVPRGFDAIKNAILDTEKKINEVKKAGLQDTPGGKTIFDAEIENLRKLRLAAGQSAESVEKEIARIRASFQGAAGSAAHINKIGAAFDALAQKGGVLGKVAGTLGPLFAKAEATLAGFGLSVQGVAVILGAGFAGGIAGLIQVGLQILRLIPQIAQAIFAIGQLGGALTHLQKQIRDTFGSASQQVIQFATDFGHALGLSEAAASTFLGRMGQLFQAQGQTAASSAELAEGLLVAASVFRDTTIGAGSFEEALRAVQNTVAGNIEGLREYNVLITEADLRSQAAARGIKIAGGALDAQTRQFLAALEVIDQAQARLRTQTEAQKSLAAQTEKLSATFTDIKTVIGQAFGAALGFALKAITPFFEALRAGFSQIREQIKDSESFRRVLGVLVGFLAQNFTNALKIAGAAISLFFDVLDVTIKAIDTLLGPINEAIKRLQGLVDGVKSALRAIGLLGEEESESAKKARELAEAENELEKSARAAAEAHEFTREELNKIIDAYDDLNRAIRDAERAEDDAERNLRRTREDNQQKLADANRAIKKAYLDRNRAIEDANEKLDDIEKQNSRSLFDAQRNLDEAELQAKRAIRDAEEKLADAREDAAKKIANAQERLEKARLARLQAILRAQLALQAAQFRFTTISFNQAQLELTQARQSDAVKEASKALDDSIAENKKNIARLERDLAEEKIDQAKRIEDAQIALARAEEDAIERVSDAKREQARAFEDADTRIKDSLRKRREVEREVERAEFDAIQRLNRAREEGVEKVADARQRQIELNREWGITVALAREYLAILDAAEKNIERQAARGHTEGFRGHGASGEFAHGGFLGAGQIGLTGERGRELVIGGSAGSHILPNDLTEALIRMAKNGGQGGGTQNVNVYEVANDPKATAFMVAAELMQGVNN